SQVWPDASPHTERIVEFVLLLVTQDADPDVAGVLEVRGKHILYDHVIGKTRGGNRSDECAIEPHFLLPDLDVGPRDMPGRNISVQQAGLAVTSLLIEWRRIHLQGDVVSKIGVKGITHELQAGPRNQKLT